jgi:hypothetical protein
VKKRNDKGNKEKSVFNIEKRKWWPYEEDRHIANLAVFLYSMAFCNFQ